MLPLQAGVNGEAVAMKGYSAFPKAPALLETSPPDCLESYQNTRCGVGGYSSVEKQSVYSTAPADWAMLMNLPMMNLPTMHLQMINLTHDES